MAGQAVDRAAGLREYAHHNASAQLGQQEGGCRGRKGKEKGGLKHLPELFLVPASVVKADYR